MAREDFTIHYDDKEIAKECGCLWDPVKKTWYHPDSESVTKRQRRILEDLERECEDRDLEIDYDPYWDRDY